MRCGQFLTHHAALIVTAVFVAGCSTAPQTDYSKVDLVRVYGTVTLDGQPLEGAIVTFESADTGTASFGLTDDSGYYELQFDSVKSGVTPGQKRIEFSTAKAVPGLNADVEGGDGEEGEGREEGGSGGRREERVPDCYNKGSALTVEVTASSGEFNFDLKSDCSTTGPTG